MHSMMQAVSRTALGVAEFLTPVLKESKFKETGVITPEEFVASGDFLVYHCPTWEWAVGDPSKRKPFLPPDKQFLKTRNVPCYRRVGQLLNQNQIEVLIEPEDPDGGWVDAYHADEQASTITEKASEMTLKDDRSENNAINKLQLNKEGDDEDDEDDDDDEAVDMAAFMKGECKIDEDDLIAPARNAVSSKIVSSHGQINNQGSYGNNTSTDILQSRSYDLHITYDKYYQTSRMWLCGYDEDGAVLTETQMFEDFSQDHVKKTVTMEIHPHLPGGNATSGSVGGVTMASIHPCRQAEVMKKLIEAVAEGGACLGVHQYILIFLKFVQAVIPTIEYDYTRNFNM